MAMKRYGLAVGLCLLATLTARAAPTALTIDPDGVQRAEIVLDSYTFTPDHLIVTVSTPVELTLRSVTWLVPHTFVLEAPEAGVKVHQRVSPGKTVTVRFTPSRSGRFRFLCDNRLLFFQSHEARGMVGTLEVRSPTP